MGADGDSGGMEPVALVADSRAAESASLARALGDMGYRVICVTTPLEMIHHLEHRRSNIRLVVVGSILGRYTGDELASFLAEAHPDVRHVLVARGTCSPARTALDSLLDTRWTEDIDPAALGPELDEHELEAGRAEPSE